MPATPFDATAHRLAAIAVHSLVTMDATVLTELQGEDFLLVQSCLRAGTSERLQESDHEGNLVLDIHFNHKLTYAVTARVLEFAGLADYHPGRALGDQQLAFANGRRAMQFGTQTGKLIYLDPRQQLTAGDLPAIDFTVEHLFIDLDLDTYPVTTTVTTLHLDSQASVHITTAAATALLRDIFHATTLLAGAVTIEFWSADPDTTGTLLGTLTSGPWTTPISEPVTPDTTLLECPANTLTGESFLRAITHLRVTRPGIPCEIIPLASTLTLPVWNQLTIDASDLSVLLQWAAQDDGTAGGAWERPARHALRYLHGDDSTAITPSATLTIEFWTADPDDAGTLLDSVVVPRDDTTWTVLDGTLTNAIAITSALTTGGTIGWIRGTLSGSTTPFINQAYGAVITAPDPFTVPAGWIELALL